MPMDDQTAGEHEQQPVDKTTSSSEQNVENHNGSAGSTESAGSASSAASASREQAEAVNENAGVEPINEQDIPTQNVRRPGANSSPSDTPDTPINEQDIPTQYVRRPRTNRTSARPEWPRMDVPTPIVRKDKVNGNTSAAAASGNGQGTPTQNVRENGAHSNADAAYTRTGDDARKLVPASTAVAKVLPHTSFVGLLNASTGSLNVIGSRGDTGDNPYLRRRRKLLLRHLSRKHMRRSRSGANDGFRRFWITIFSICAAFATIFLTITGAGSYASYRFYTDTQAQFAPKITTLRDLLPQDNLRMFDSKGIPIMQMTDQGIHTSVPLNQITPTLINATVATEDKNFWTNPGVDILRIAQAALDDLRHGHVVEGGSTITQQLIKNLVVGHDANVLRKLQEVVLTPDVNSHYSKSDIMEMYLNSIYYGEQAYGVDAAATIYFGLVDEPGRPAASQLDLAQAAALAGTPSSPTLYDPRINKPIALKRMQVVLDLMMRDGYITPTQADGAVQEFNKPDFIKAPAQMSNRAPHFTEFVLRQLEQQFHKTRAELSRSGMNVYTTLDINLQDRVQKIMQDHIAELRDAHHMSNAAEVIIDYHTGAVKSLLGSIDYNSKEIDGKFDVATLGYRQPGSSFKPYVYATALKQGASPAQAILDEPITINIPDSNPPTYKPVNYDHQFHGHMTIRCALQNSLNIPAVKTLEHVGIQNAVQTAHNMGVVHTQGQPGYSMVLGGLDVNLLEHTSAYGTFADGGVHVPAYSIEKIVMAETKQTFGHPANPGTRVLSSQVAYMMTDVLSDNQSRYMEFGPCSSLLLYSNTMNQCYAGNKGDVRPAAAKTGTTNDFVDNWTMGYTTDYVMGVWAGNNDHSPMIDITGVDGAAPIWHDSMLAAEEGHPIHNFQYPGGLERKEITYPDGVHTTDWFQPGTYPKFDANKSVTPTPTPTDGNTGLNLDTNKQEPVITHPYCTTFNYSFNPPAGKATLDGPWW
ncbi:MAG: hypothetical protein NVS2B12_08010 [Ktedonobacteraceae bacterium]